MGPRLLASMVVALSLVLLGCSDREPFYGDHQAGIATPEQKFAFVAAFDVTTTKAAEVRELLKTWTIDAEALTQGKPLPGPKGSSVPPADTGEALDHNTSHLTLTFGVGPSLFDDRFGLASQRPAALVPLPAFPGDQLKPELSYGDLVVQVGADDFQVAYHALHTLTRAAQGVAVVRWVQSGFSPNRNLQGFKDGTVNPDTTNADDMNAVVWVGPGSWMSGGSYLVVRHIRMLVEAWDRSSLMDQERSVGRDRQEGNPLATQPETSHMRLAHGAGVERILRRPYSFVNGLDPKTGQWDSGLLFLAWMKDPGRQFVPMQQRLSAYDGLGEYLRYESSAVFAVFPGLKKGDYLGEALFPEEPLTQRIEGLLGTLGAAFPALGTGDWTTVRAQAAQADRQWKALRPEAGSRGEALEALNAAWVATLVADSPDPTSARRALAALAKGVDSWATSTQTKGSVTDLGPLKAKVKGLSQAVASGDAAAARRAYTEFQNQWLTQEALVRTLDGPTYAAGEAALGSLRTALAGTAPASNALTTVRDLESRFDRLGSPKAFGALDAGFLLFREGLEALLVLAALLAFLGRTGQSGRAVWVWAGAGSGVAASVAVAGVVSVALAGLAAGAPSLVEGLTGLVAVVLMLTVGAWLHSKSRIRDWNRWFKDRLDRVGTRGWALGALAFVSVFREGAETVVFFWGLAGSISGPDLALGLGGAAVVLVLLGVVLLGFSKRLPLQWFFPVATALIYFLAVKILGQSLGSLQSAGWLSATALGVGTEVDWLGFAPTWETAVAQGVLVGALTVLLIGSMVRGRPKNQASSAT